MSGQTLRVLLVHPGASWSTADVEAGLRVGLQAHGVDVVRYRLDGRIAAAKGWLELAWRQKKKHDKTVQRPTSADVFYKAAIDALEMALRFEVDAVVIVSAMFFPLEAIKRLKQARLNVFVLFTESPYDVEQELAVAAMVDGCWTNERSSVAPFRSVNPRSGYIPHGWHPERHRPGLRIEDQAIPQHDVVFVGSAFHERVTWLEAIDWTGIDLGLYGTWDSLSRKSPLKPFVRHGQIDNMTTAALYRRAKVGLNLYRRSKGWGKHAPQIDHAESLNPRAYELAACGAFHVSDYRAEVAEVFGDRVPTFQSPSEAAALIRTWLADDAGRAAIASQLPACVAGASWVERATCVIGDLQLFLSRKAA